jgi:hypothetical protein
MKLTRKQLRTLIQESIINEMPMIKPGGDIPPDRYEKILQLYGEDEDGDEYADYLAHQHGHDTEHLSKDLEKYDQVSIMGTAGEFMAKLEPEQLKLLMSARNQNLVLVYTLAGFGFEDENGNYVITEGQLYSMAKEISDPEERREAGYEFNDDIDDVTLASMFKLIKSIIAHSKRTRISSIDFEDIRPPVAVVVGNRDYGRYKFLDPDFQQLYLNKKLVIGGGYVEPSTLDLD